MPGEPDALWKAVLGLMRLLRMRHLTLSPSSYLRVLALGSVLWVKNVAQKLGQYNTGTFYFGTASLTLITCVVC